MNYDNQRAKDVAQLEEYLTSMHEILGSIPSTAKTDQEWRHMPVLPAFGRQRQETQKFKVNLYYSMSLRTALATWNLSFSQQASNPDKFHCLHHPTKLRIALRLEARSAPSHLPSAPLPFINKSTACLADIFRLFPQ